MISQRTVEQRTPFYDRFASGRALNIGLAAPRALVIGGLLVIALVAFEVFNYDTTRYALESLLGEVRVLGVKWAVVLAIAFCAIDFAGLARLFTPDQAGSEQRAVWYLMGAWLLGASMNAVMTWWAVNLTLLNHELGNEVMSRQELLRFVPLFVAVLVWLTRILFIGAFSLAGEHLFRVDEARTAASPSARRAVAGKTPAPALPGSGGTGRQTGRAGYPGEIHRQPAVARSPRPARSLQARGRHS